MLAVVTAVGFGGLQLPVGATSVSVTVAGAPAALTTSFGLDELVAVGVDPAGSAR